MKKIFYTFCFFTIFSCSQPSKEIIKLNSIQYQQSIVAGDSLLQLIDVRTPEEYDVSHLKNAQNICVTDKDFKDKIKSLDKDKAVYVYCKKGGRSARAADILRNLGFTKIYDLEGGIISWEKDGLELVN